MDKDYKPKSSPAALEEFMKGSIYQDFLNELDSRISRFRDLLEEAPSKAFHEIQGGVRNARQMKEIFKDMLRARNADLYEKEHDRQSERGD